MKNYKYILSILLILFLPEGISIHLHINTISFGALVSWIFILFLNYRRNDENLRFNNYFFVLLFIILFFIILSLFSGIIINRNFNYNRYFLSTLLIIIELFSAFVLTKKIRQLPSSKLDFYIKKIAIILLLLSYVSLLKWTLTSASSKEMIFFTEPSHYAIASSPFFIYYIFKSEKKNKILFTLLLFLAALLMENLTLLLPLIIAIAFYNKKILLIFTSIMTVLLPIIGPKYYAYITARTTTMLDSDNENLSALVYLQGWEYVIATIKTFNGFGIGFQQLGEIRLQSKSQDLLEYLGYPFNQNDGSFFFSKFFVEFGWIALLTTIIYLVFTIIIYFNLNKILKSNDSFKLFTSITFISFLIPLFVRSSSYYNPTLYIFYMSIISFGLNSNTLNEKK